MRVRTYCMPGIGLLFIILFTIAAVSVFSLTAESKDIKYIDAHNHLAGRFGPPSRQILDYEGAAQVALGEMNKFGIKKMLIMPPPFPPGHKYQYECDDFLEIAKKYPDRFAFLGGGRGTRPGKPVLVPRGGQPIGGQCYGQRAAGHEAEIARPRACDRGG